MTPVLLTCRHCVPPPAKLVTVRAESPELVHVEASGRVRVPVTNGLASVLLLRVFAAEMVSRRTPAT
jgi:hypothetical protein